MRLSHNPFKFPAVKTGYLLLLTASILIQLIAAAASDAAGRLSSAAAYPFLFHSLAFILGKSVVGSVGQVFTPGNRTQITF